MTTVTEGPLPTGYIPYTMCARKVHNPDVEVRFHGLPETLRCNDLLDGLPATTLAAFEAIQVRQTYPAEATLFVEDETASSIYIIQKGSVRLSESQHADPSAAWRITLPGEILGLAATVSGGPYQAVAQTLEPTHIGLIRQKDLARFLSRHGAVAFRLVQLLSDCLATAFEHARDGLTQ